jgi:Contractile injection system tube protein
MERVAFLLEETNERLGCLLNPDSLVIRRAAGVLPRRSLGGQFTGVGLRDDPLLYTGGGMTELELNLLFDVSLAGSSIETNDVRDLTGPLWNLAENAHSVNGYRRPPLVRFVWGKSWNIPGIVAAVAEYLEQFTADGAPQRSWLSMRLWRVSEPQKETVPGGQPLQTQALSPADLEVSPGSVSPDHVQVHVVSVGERLDEIAARYYPDQPAAEAPALWRTLASFNGLEDPLHIPAGTILRVPPLSALGGGS